MKKELFLCQVQDLLDLTADVMMDIEAVIDVEDELSLLRLNRWNRLSKLIEKMNEELECEEPDEDEDEDEGFEDNYDREEGTTYDEDGNYVEE